MFKKLSLLSEKKRYWLSLAVLCVFLEVAALFYQYVLNYNPCILCIHVRLWVFGILLLSLLALLLRHNRFTLLLVHVLMTGFIFGLAERSYMLLGTERGFVTGDCGFGLGLPAWFAPDKWLPFMFKALESCGYTPELFFGITMAEALMVLSAVLLLLSVVMTISVVVEKFVSRGAK